ncbi:FAD-dependent oxidoreductase [Longispora sp. K20-0274]|uniref:FAD-binding oxidoreductase n=1 Tax=Longispora sp. K20-0274 TaxID=3088255 RepID=UPI00399A4AE9
MTTLGAPPTATVSLPGDPAFEAATRVFNLYAPARPAAAVTARTVDEVRAAIRAAARRGLSVRVHATGHSSGAVRPMADALLIRTELVGGVHIDPHRLVARVPAGTPWGVVVEAAARYGLAAPHGSSPTVGVVGYLLRGGVSLYGRHVGLAANSVRAVELVTADGESRRVNARTDPELFWALRGGGGGFGVVTAVEVALFPATAVIAGAAFWSAAHAPDLLSAWRRWTVDAPTEVSTSLRVMNLPDLPEIPPMLSAGPVLCVAGVALGTDGYDVTTARAQADDLLGPLRAVAEPLFDTWQPTTPAAVTEAHMDPTDPVGVVGDHLLLGELDDAGAAEFLRVVGAPDSPLISAELRQLGGRLSLPDPTGGALDRLDARFAYMGAGVPELRSDPSAIEKHLAVVRAALTPWDTGRTAPTFVESPDQPQRHLDPDRVRAADLVRRRVDPDGVFRGDIAPQT